MANIYSLIVAPSHVSLNLSVRVTKLISAPGLKSVALRSSGLGVDFLHTSDIIGNIVVFKGRAFGVTFLASRA